MKAQEKRFQDISKKFDQINRHSAEAYPKPTEESTLVGKKYSNKLNFLNALFEGTQRMGGPFKLYQ